MKFGIVFGGVSFEHEISIVSAIAVKKALKCKLSFIFVDKFGDFYLINSDDMRANFFSSHKYKNSKKLHLKKGGFAAHGIFGMNDLNVDCYINLIHGRDGEDGKIAGMFEFYNVTFIGPRLEASVMSFNKELTKLLAHKCAVKSLPYEMIKRGDIVKTELPFILKPARLGSSIGVSVVRDISNLDYALDVAFEFDKDILVEPFKEGIREFNLAGFKAENDFIYSFIEEPKKNDFLDFEQKYMSFSSSCAKEADIDDSLKIAIKDAFAKIYNGGNFDGALIRCDFFVLDNEVYLNEINPNPGSMANYLFTDFTSSVEKLANSIKPSKNIDIDYKFINSITSNKGKLA
ncbi:D-alanine--D-alanine ligase [Campylobacter fetus]|uniref:D-alanine--D-alanine ligase n=1 Tax=Campylobacter fetus TaxID=196 RepID=UPI00081897A4|nr:D-alanine--D-alanine ligase [Campylobacter fetus]EAH8299497.1 D-alanine--D-alanine ligase [Campylobacter fetus]EAI7232095.1 D-alanine--D-alanine ligase [Campylobacter fetus]EAJ5690621.1 D-alanine--D-alanine ligase [Campylobacter fetus]EAK0427602.1 D-alanine--D-alanine ligase [Campylobacter fetus]EAK5304551.1 D-alanine--D-alanine ligase [Campylobacter fetus]